MKKISRICAAIVGACCSAACTTVTPSLPPGYSGPTAEIRDSVTVKSRSNGTSSTLRPLTEMQSNSLSIKPLVPILGKALT